MHFLKEILDHWHTFFYFVAVVLYAIFASYFAGVMVRLMLTLTPVVCVLAAIAFSKTFEIYLKDDTPKSQQKNSEDGGDNRNDRLYDKVCFPSNDQKDSCFSVKAMLPGFKPWKHITKDIYPRSLKNVVLVE